MTILGCLIQSRGLEIYKPTPLNGFISKTILSYAMLRHLHTIHSHVHPIIVASSVVTETIWYTKLKYLLTGPLKKKFADSRSRSNFGFWQQFKRIKKKFVLAVLLLARNPVFPHISGLIIDRHGDVLEAQKALTYLLNQQRLNLTHCGLCYLDSQS